MEPEIVFCTKSYLVIIYIFEARNQGISSCILFKLEVTQFLRNKAFWNLGINLLTTAASSDLRFFSWAAPSNHFRSCSEKKKSIPFLTKHVARTCIIKDRCY